MRNRLAQLEWWALGGSPGVSVCFMTLCSIELLDWFTLSTTNWERCHPVFRLTFYAWYWQSNSAGSVGIATTPRVGRSRVRNTLKERNIFLLPKRQYHLWGQPSPLYNTHRGYWPEVKPRREEWMDLYICTTYTPSQCGEGQIYLYFAFLSFTWLQYYRV